MYIVPVLLPNGELMIKLNNLTIRGKSTGGKETSIIVEELSIAFDAGYPISKLETVQNVAISHGHADHISCLHLFQSSKKQKHITTPWQIIMPENCIEPFKTITTVFSSLARGGYPIEFRECKFDDGSVQKVIKPYENLRNHTVIAEECKEVPMINKKNFIVNAYEMNHRIKSFGYIIYEQRKKLKTQYIGLSPQEYKTLKKANIEINTQIKIPIIGFTGDTQIDAILNNEEFLNVPIILMECTHFEYNPLDPSITLQDAMDHGHVHFKQFFDNINKFNNKYIVLCHFSQKYRTIADIDPYIKLLTPEQQQRIVVWIAP